MLMQYDGVGATVEPPVRMKWIRNIGCRRVAISTLCSYAMGGLKGLQNIPSGTPYFIQASIAANSEVAMVMQYGRGVRRCFVASIVMSVLVPTPMCIAVTSAWRMIQLRLDLSSPFSISSSSVLEPKCFYCFM